jgi:hypothetical protein
MVVPTTARYGERMRSVVVTTNTKKCPRCETPLVATERREPVHPDVLQFRAGSPVPLRRSIPVWHCATCREDRARFE